MQYRNIQKRKEERAAVYDSLDSMLCVQNYGLSG